MQDGAGGYTLRVKLISQLAKYPKLYRFAASVKENLKFWHLGLWHRDYFKVFANCENVKSISMEKMSPEVWASPGWSDTGVFVTARLNKGGVND